MYNSDSACEQVTKHLRTLTEKNARYTWTEECEAAYREIIAMMTSDTTLRPFDPDRKTILVADASPTGIAAGVYQEDDNGRWMPIDHSSRGLTDVESHYSQTERESLAQVWGMNTFRYYLLVVNFDAYTDHQPLLPILGEQEGDLPHGAP